MNKFLFAILLLSSSAFIAAGSLSPLDLTTDKPLVSTDSYGNLVDNSNDITGDVDSDCFVYQHLTVTFSANTNSIFFTSHQDDKTNALLKHSLIPRAPPFI